MKKILICLGILIPAFASCQIEDVMLGIETDTVFVDDTTYTVYYVLSDTTGDMESGNYKVTTERMDSATIIQKLYRSIFNAYNRVGEVEAVKFNAFRQAAAYRNAATQIKGEDTYREDIGPQVRSGLSGLYAYRYDGTLRRIESEDGFRFRDKDTNALILTSAPFSKTLVTFVDRTASPEAIQMYRISDGFYIGDGSKGRAILRKLRDLPAQNDGIPR